MQRWEKLGLVSGAVFSDLDGDGKLEFVRKYDVEVGNRQMFWMGMVAL